MKRRNSLLENLDSKVRKNLPIRRYSLSDMISESYKALYECEKGSTLQRIVEAHLNDVRNNPSEIDRLSTQLCKVKELVRMIEAEEITDKDLKSVVSSKINGEVKESKDDEDVEEKDDKDVIDEFVHDEDVEETEDEDLLEDSELTDEEVDELTKHLEEIRKNKKMKECDAPKKEVQESTKPRKLKRANESTKELHETAINGETPKYAVINPDGTYAGVFCTSEDEARELAAQKEGRVIFKLVSDEKTNESATVWSRYHIVNPDGETIDSYTDRKDAEDWVNQLYKDGDYKKGDLKVVDSQAKNESKSYEKLNLSEFNKKSSSKAFVKTFKKLDKKLHEGTALTRQESISLYKAANSAMTHLSVELEHNPEFLDTFKESVSLLSVDVDKLLGSLKEGKAPSKATMKSLAKFSEALLREEEEVEDDIPIEDEEDSVSEESEEFDQEYADARVELHKELADEHAESEDPEVQEKLAQDAEEVTSLPGITDEQVAEITGEETPEEEEVEETDESVHDEDVEEVEEKKEEEPEDLDLGSEDEITDDELAELKKHLKEMRKARISESKKTSSKK